MLNDEKKVKFQEYINSKIYNKYQLAVIHKCIEDELDDTMVSQRLYNDKELEMLYYGISYDEKAKSKIKIYFDEYQMNEIYQAMYRNKYLINEGDPVINIKLFASHWYTWDQMYVAWRGQALGIDYNLFLCREYSSKKMAKIVNKELKKENRIFDKNAIVDEPESLITFNFMQISDMVEQIDWENYDNIEYLFTVINCKYPGNKGE